MSSDEKMNATPATAGRKVAFVGGPNAGQARIIPESAGEFVGAAGDFIYRIIPFAILGTKVIYFAYAADQHPVKLLYKMWEEYSIAAQIRGGDFGHIKRLADDIKTR